jgi:hypothetical protein
MKYHDYINVFHVFVIAPVLFMIGYNRNTTLVMYNILMGMGYLLIVLHGYKAIYGKKYQRIIHLIHALIVGPLFVYIGTHQDKTPRRYFEFLLVLTFAAFGYSGLNLFRSTYSLH